MKKKSTPHFICWMILSSGRILRPHFLVFSICGLLLFSTSADDKTRHISLVDTPREEGIAWVQNLLKGMSLEQKVGQMIQIRCYPDYANNQSPDYLSIRSLIQQYHIGSVVLGMHISSGGPLRSSPIDVARTVNRLQKDSTLPLLIAADIERGLASRMADVPSFPWPMAFGAAGNVSDAERFGELTALEARSVGIQWAFAPVADVNSNPANPIINDRSFGEDPKQVATLVSAFIRGAHKNGLLLTAKHFPGQGDSSLDSHRGVSLITSDVQHLEKFELPPFESAIDARVDSVMLANIRVPALEPDLNKVATTSYNIATKVLRERLGFKGLIVTDALEMKGITALYDRSKRSPTAMAAVDAVKAGCDVISIPTDLDGAFHAILDAVNSGEIQITRIDESVRRILLMKAGVGLNRSRIVSIEDMTRLINQPEGFELAQGVSDKAITLVKYNGRRLPFDALVHQTSEALAKPNRSMVVIFMSDELESTNGHEFEAEFKQYRPETRFYYVDNRTATAGGIEILKNILRADEVVVVGYFAHRGARQLETKGASQTVFGLAGPSGRLLHEILRTDPENTIVVAMGSPYVIENFPEIQNYICTYAMAVTSERSAVKALFGEIQNHATLPVTLSGTAKRGFAIPWPSKSSMILNSAAGDQWVVTN